MCYVPVKVMDHNTNSCLFHTFLYTGRFQLEILKIVTNNMSGFESRMDLYRNINNNYNLSISNLSLTRFVQKHLQYLQPVNVHAIFILRLVLSWAWRPQQDGLCAYLQQVIIELLVNEYHTGYVNGATS